MSAAVTEESTPPDMATTTRCLRGAWVLIARGYIAWWPCCQAESALLRAAITPSASLTPFARHPPPLVYARGGGNRRGGAPPIFLPHCEAMVGGAERDIHRARRRGRLARAFDYF